MANRVVEIAFKTMADPAGAQKAQAEIRKTAEAAKSAGKDRAASEKEVTAELGKQKSILDTIVKEGLQGALGEQGGGVAAKITQALGRLGAIGAATVVVTKTVLGFFERWATNLEKSAMAADKVWQSTQKIVQENEKNIRAVSTEAELLKQRVKLDQQSAETRAKILELMNQGESKNRLVIDAEREKLERIDHQRQALEHYYAQNQRRLESENKIRQVLAEQAEQLERQNRAAEASAAVDRAQNAGQSNEAQLAGMRKKLIDQVNSAGFGNFSLDAGIDELQAAIQGQATWLEMLAQIAELEAKVTAEKAKQAAETDKAAAAAAQEAANKDAAWQAEKNQLKIAQARAAGDEKRAAWMERELQIAAQTRALMDETGRSYEEARKLVEDRVKAEEQALQLKKEQAATDKEAAAAAREQQAAAKEAEEQARRRAESEALGRAGHAGGRHFDTRGRDITDQMRAAQLAGRTGIDYAPTDFGEMLRPRLAPLLAQSDQTGNLDIQAQANEATASLEKIGAAATDMVAKVTAASDGATAQINEAISAMSSAADAAKASMSEVAAGEKALVAALNGFGKDIAGKLSAIEQEIATIKSQVNTPRA